MYTDQLEWERQRLPDFPHSSCQILPAGRRGGICGPVRGEGLGLAPQWCDPPYLVCPPAAPPTFCLKMLQSDYVCVRKHAFEILAGRPPPALDPHIDTTPPPPLGEWLPVPALRQ